MAFSDRFIPRLFQGLMNRLGLTREQAEGVVGNLAHESQGFTDLTEDAPTVPGSRGGYGIAQWTGPRRRQYERWARDNGLDPASEEANTEFLFHEMETTERAALDRLRQARTAEEATQIFSDSFLRPGIPGMNSRQAFTDQMAAYAPWNTAPVPPPRPPRLSPQLPPLMDEVTGNPLGNPSFPMSPPTLQPPAGDGSRVQTASLSPTQSAGLDLINGAQNTLSKLALRNSPPALGPMPAPITSGSRGGSLNTESTYFPMTNKVKGDELARGARTTLASLASMVQPSSRYANDQRFNNPAFSQRVAAALPSTGFPTENVPTLSLADVGSHLPPIPPMRPDDLGTGGPDMTMPAPTPPPRPGSLGTRSNPVGQGVTPPVRTAANDPLVGLLNSRFPVPANPGTGGPLAATPASSPVAAPRPSSFAPGSPEIARYAAMYAPFAQQAAPVTQQPVPLPIPRPTIVAPPQPAVSQPRPAARPGSVGTFNGQQVFSEGKGVFRLADGTRVYRQH